MKPADMEQAARSYLAAAAALNVGASVHPDAAVYLCGYAVELALKARICRTLGWVKYPTSDDYKSFKIHKLDTLLHLAGSLLEDSIISPKAPIFADWSTVRQWNPEQRYRPVVTKTAKDATDMIEAVTNLLALIL